MTVSCHIPERNGTFVALYDGLNLQMIRKIVDTHPALQTSVVLPMGTSDEGCLLILDDKTLQGFCQNLNRN
jgi:hypothetical protein